MTKKLKEVDAVVIGMGWSGGIFAKELAEAGLTVIGLERGGPRSSSEDFSVPHIRDELQYSVRHQMMQDVRLDTLTIRNNIDQEALPMRKLSSFLPGDGVGGSGAHWNGLSWRWSDMEFKIRSMYEERYGRHYIPADMPLQDWGVTYSELEPHYEKFEYTAGVSGAAADNPHAPPRKAPYPLPPLHTTLACELFAKTTRSLGYSPFNSPAANASQAFLNRDGVQMGQCQYCGFCDKFGCEANAKGSPHNTVIPAAQRRANFTLQAHARVVRLEKDRSGNRITGVEYINMLTGETLFQPARMVILAAYALNNTHLLLTSGIGKPYDPVSQTGLIGKNHCYNTGSGAQLFFEDKTFNPYMSAGGTSMAIDDFYANWDFDRAQHGYIGGSVIMSGMSGGRPILYHPVPTGTPRWGSEWKKAMAKWYQRAMSVRAMSSMMPNRYNYLDLDPTYRDATGAAMLRLTFDFTENDRRVAAHAAQLVETISTAMKPTLLNKPVNRTKKSYSIVGYQGTHNTGGTIMGSNPGESFTNKYGQSWEYPNLFIGGGSLFPHNAAHNPTATIAALAFFSTEAISSRYLKSEQPLV